MRTFRVSLLVVSLLLIISGCHKDNPIDTLNQDSQSNNAVHTFVLSSPDDSRLPAPMAEDQEATDNDRALMHGVMMEQRHHGDGHQQASGTPSVLWNELTTELGLKAGLPPPKIARAYALVHVAIYDALVAAHETRRRDLWDNAVAAGAASKVLLYLFPNDSSRIRRVIPSQLRVEHGLAIGRVLRSWVLGRRVGQLVVMYGQHCLIENLG